MKQNRVVIIDTETTGLSILQGDRIIEIAAVEVVNGQLTDRQYHTLVNPDGRKITHGAFKKHGIHNYQLLNEPVFAEISEELTAFCEGAKIVTYNAQFDGEMLESDFKRAGIELPNNLAIENIECLMVRVTQHFNRKRHFKLDDACNRFNILQKLNSDDLNWHRALSDAKVAALLYIELEKLSNTPNRKPSPKKEKDSTPAKRKPFSSKSPKPSSSTKKPERHILVPRAARHPITGDLTQLNCCRNPSCSNYGVPPKNPKRTATGYGKKQLPNDYKISGNIDRPVLTCKICGYATVMLNNRSTMKQFDLDIQRQETKIIVCPEPDCANHNKDMKDHPYEYALKGTQRVKQGHGRHALRYRKTFAENNLPAIKPNPVEHYVNDGRLPSQKIQCKGCEKIFTVKQSPEARHYRANTHIEIFQDLMSKSTYKAIQDYRKVQPKTIYDKINFFHNQFLTFEKWHLQNLPNVIAAQSLSLSTDRQYYNSAWMDDGTYGKLTALKGIATVDNNSGFVFASSVNFDYWSDAMSIRQNSAHTKDNQHPRHERRYAEYSLPDTYVSNEDIQRDANLKRILRYQGYGIAFHETYQMLNHFLGMQQLLSNCPELVWSMDGDLGMSQAFHAIFNQDIEKGKIHSFLIQHQPKQILESDKKAFENIYHSVGLSNSNHAMRKEFWQSGLLPEFRLQQNKQWQWYRVPNEIFHRITGIAPITRSSDDIDLQKESEHVARTGLYGVDRFFLKARRTVKALERPITSAHGRKNYSHAGYNPEWLCKLADIFRVYYNFCVPSVRVGDERVTPSTSLGLTKKTTLMEEVFAFTPAREIIKHRKRTVEEKPKGYQSPDDGEYRFLKR